MIEPLVIKPNRGPQTDFLASSADIVIFGGSGGGGKSYGLLLEPLNHIDNPKFSCAIFRRTYADITKPGAIWDESCALYNQMGAVQNKTLLSWQWPSGARVTFTHMQTDEDRFDYQGAQINFIGYDELTHFSDTVFWYMLSRNRSISGIKPYIRCTTNPDSDSWVRAFVDWWIGPDGYAIQERSGVVRYFVKADRDIKWFDDESKADEYAKANLLSYKSFTFIRSNLSDNPILMAKDPGYLANLKALGLVDRERLLMGNWNVRYQAGNVFKRENFKIVDALPAGTRRTVRAWDRAATLGGGDFTAGAKVSRDDKGRYYVEDMLRGQWNPLGVEQAIVSTASRDGTRVDICLEQEPGSSGVADVQYLIRQLGGYNARPDKKTGSKIDLARPVSAQVEAGNVFILRAPWNLAFLNEMESFDGQGDTHDDQVDAVSAAFDKLNHSPAIVGTI